MKRRSFMPLCFPAASWRGTVCAALVFAWGSALAHGIALEVEADGSTLRGAARYSDRSPAAREPVFIYSPPESKSPVAETMTAGDGRFSFEAAPGRSYRVVVEAGEGHQVERIVAVAADSGRSPATGGALQRADLDAALLPLREDLARLERQWRLTDLFAGLGYVFGLYGLISTMRRRNR